MTHAVTTDTESAPPQPQPEQPPLPVSIAGLLADALPQHTYLVGGRLVELVSAAADGQELDVELRLINFQAADDPRLRVRLAVSIPAAEDAGPAEGEDVDESEVSAT